MTDGSPRILLVRLSAIGDCLHAIPVLVALRQQWPQAFIGWAVERASLTLLEGHPMVDRFHLYPRHVFRDKGVPFFKRLEALSRFREALRETRYDTAIDLQGLTKSGLVAWWSGAPRRIGFRGEDSRELNALFVNRRVRAPRDAAHVVDRNLALVQDLEVKPPRPPQWVMPLYRKETQEMDAFLAACGMGQGPDRRPFAIVNPGAAWLTKRWPAERFGEVAKRLGTEHDLPVVATWSGEAERAAAERIVEAGGSASGRAFLAPPTDLRQLAALTARASLFVGNDTGPLHLAVAMGVPCVAVFGGSDPKRNGPYGLEHRVEVAGPECRPCWKTTCERRDLACLMGVTPERVAMSCAEVLARERRTAPV